MTSRRYVRQLYKPLQWTAHFLEKIVCHTCFRLFEDVIVEGRCDMLMPQLELRLLGPTLLGHPGSYEPAKIVRFDGGFQRLRIDQSYRRSIMLHNPPDGN